MKFANIEYLYFLILLPLLIIYYIFVFKARRKALDTFINPQMQGVLVEGFSLRRLRIKSFLLILSILFLILALSGPLVGYRAVQIKEYGLEVIIALDCSLSMQAEDIKPTRLERAKSELLGFIEELQGNRIGIITFAGNAFLQCPPTLDQIALKMFLDIVDPKVFPIRGTAIGEAINLAIRTFSPKEGIRKVLILLTDGEDQGSHPLEAARNARQKRIIIYTVGIGTPDGEPIPLRDSQGKIIGFKKDKADKTVMSKLDEENLKKIAMLTGGKYFRVSDTRFELAKISRDITRMDKELLAENWQDQYENRYQYFLFLALIFLVGEFLISERSPVKGKKLLLIIFMFFFVFLSADIALASPALKIKKGNRFYKQGEFKKAEETYRDAQIDYPNFPVLHFNRGNSLYKSNEYQQAMEEYRRAVTSSDKILKAKVYYNMGNTLYRQGKLKQALQFYRKALIHKPKDRDAQLNLEFVLKKLQEQKEKEKSEKKSGNGEKKKDEQKKKEDSKEGKNEKSEKEKEKKSGMSAEDIERILNILREKEKEALKRKNIPAYNYREVDKDW